MGINGTEETTRFRNVHRVRNGRRWTSTLRLKKNTEALTKYSNAKHGRFYVGTFASQGTAGFAKNVYDCASPPSACVFSISSQFVAQKQPDLVNLR
jgi:hypothetical protein